MVKQKKILHLVLLKFHGGCQQIGMSCVEVEAENGKILLDCGMEPNTGEIPKINDKAIDAVIVSHAHLDHCGAIPFYKFKKIYCTHPTADLMFITWKDTLNLTKAYKEEDIQQAMESIECLNYYEEREIKEGIKFKFYNAGHILGSASIYLEVDGKKILYTGDINEGVSRTLLPADTDIDEIDVLIIESTYGSPLDIKPARKTLERQLIEEIAETIENGGKVIIPVFAIGRAQEILLIINNYMRSGVLKEVPIYTDGALIHATAVYMSYINWLNPKIKNMVENKEYDAEKYDDEYIQHLLNVARELHEERSEQAQEQDEKFKSKKVIDLEKSKHPEKDLERWSRNMGKMDILGIDFIPDFSKTLKKLIKGKKAKS